MFTTEPNVIFVTAFYNLAKIEKNDKRITGNEYLKCSEKTHSLYSLAVNMLI